MLRARGGGTPGPYISAVCVSISCRISRSGIPFWLLERINWEVQPSTFLGLSMPEAQAGVLMTSDEQLVQLAREGDRLAREELFRRHWAVSYRVAYRQLGHEQDALDAVQEAFLKAVLH